MLLTLAVLLWSIGSALTPLAAHSVVSTATARAVVGVGHGISMPAVSTLVASEIRVQRTRDQVVPFAYSGFAIGSIVGLVVVDRMITTLGTGGMFFTCAGIGVVWVAFFWCSLMFGHRKDLKPNEKEKATPKTLDDFLNCPDKDLPLGDSSVKYMYYPYLSPPKAPPNREGNKLDSEDDYLSDSSSDSSFDIESVESDGSMESEEETVFENPRLNKWYRKPPSVRSILTNRAFVAAVVANTCFSWGYFVSLTWLPTFLHSSYALDLSVSVLYSTIPWAAVFICSNVGSLLSFLLTHFTSLSLTTVRKLMQLLAFVMPSCLLVGVMVTSSVGVALGCVAAALGMSAFSNAAVYPNHHDIGPHICGTLIGISNTVATLVSIFGVLATGFIVNVEDGDWDAVFGTTIGLYLLGAVVYTSFGSAKRQW